MPVEAPARHEIRVEKGKAEVTLGRAFSTAEEQWLHDHIVSGLRRLDAVHFSQAHLVKVKPKWGVELFERLNDDGTIAQKFGEQVQTNRPTNCPDCGRELIGASQERGFDYLRCPNANPLPKGASVPEWGDVVACGAPKADPTDISRSRA